MAPGVDCFEQTRTSHRSKGTLLCLFGFAGYLFYLGADLEIRVHGYPEYKVPTSERPVPIDVKGRGYYVSEADARLYNLIFPIGSASCLLLAVGCGALTRRWQQ